MTTPGHSLERSYTLGELMVASAAREIRDGEVVFVGMRLPLIAFVVAKRTHAPRAVGLFENGVIRSVPAGELIYTMADPPNIMGATYCGDMMTVMGLLQSGRVDLGFLGAAEVDRFGNLNSTQVFSNGRMTRLPGSGGACDIASLAQRFVAMLEHSRQRLPERVAHVTSPGNGAGLGWRRQAGLARGGPAAAITTKAVLRFAEDGEAYLASVHPGISIEDVLANTGWKLRVADDVRETPEPTPAELAAIRDYDKQGFWTGSPQEQITKRTPQPRREFPMARPTARPASNAPHEFLEHSTYEAPLEIRPRARFQHITLDFAAPVARITLKTPPLNIITMGMMDDLVAAMEAIDEREDMVCIVIAGGEQAFSVGVDIAIHTPDKIQQMLGKMHSVIRCVLDTQKITVAAVQGHCLGGGAELAMVCDMVYTAESANWQFPEIKLACFPPLACAALAPLAGQKRAAELILTGRAFSGAEAAQMGLATAAVAEAELENRVQQVTESLAGLSPEALRLTKKALHTWEAFHLDKGMARAEKIYLEEVMRTADAREGITAFLEKREPVWKKAA